MKCGRPTPSGQRSLEDKEPQSRDSYHGVATEVQKCPCSPLWAASPGDPSKDYVMRSSTGEHPISRRGGTGISKSCFLETPHIDGRRIFTAVHRLHRHQDAHLRGNLDHASPSHNARLSATNSAVATPLSSIFIRPRGPSNSTTAPGRVPKRGAISSTNVGGAVRRARRGP